MVRSTLLATCEHYILLCLFQVQHPHFLIFSISTFHQLEQTHGQDHGETQNVGRISGHQRAPPRARIGFFFAVKWEKRSDGGKFPQVSIQDPGHQFTKHNTYIRSTSNHLRKSNAAAVLTVFPLVVAAGNGAKAATLVVHAMPPHAAKII